MGLRNYFNRVVLCLKLSLVCIKLAFIIIKSKSKFCACAPYVLFMACFALKLVNNELVLQLRVPFLRSNVLVPSLLPKVPPFTKKLQTWQLRQLHPVHSLGSVKSCDNLERTKISRRVFALRKETNSSGGNNFLCSSSACRTTCKDLRISYILELSAGWKVRTR